MYNIIAKSRTKDELSGKVYAVTLRKWDMPCSPYEVVCDVEDADNDYSHRVYEYGSLEHAREMFLFWIDDMLRDSMR